MTRALRSLFPGAVVFVVASIALAVPGWSTAAARFAATYGMIVYGAGLALAWAFYRSRVFILLACLAGADFAIRRDAAPEDLAVALVTAIIALIALLALSRDRGVLSRGGVLQLSLAAGVAVGAAFLFIDEPERAQRFAAPLALPVPALGWPGMPRVTLLVAAAAFIAVTYGFYRWRGPVDRGLVWCLLLLLVAIHPEIGAEGFALFLLATGLTLTLSVVETSYALAYRDELTDLPGRRALMQYLDGIGGTYTVAMVDVDHFKKFNDKHGHDVGDQVLRMVASRLARAPGGGKAYRYGGEEFTLIYPGLRCDEAEPWLEAVRTTIGKAKFSIRSWRRPVRAPDAPRDLTEARKARTLSVTISIGMADTTSSEDSAEAVLKRADEALYRAKKGGRDRVSS